MADLPQHEAIQQPIVESKGRPVPVALETPSLEPIGVAETPPVAESKGRPVATLETARQPQPIQTPSPETLPVPALQRNGEPSAGPPLSDQESTRSSHPFQIHTKPAPAAQTPIQPRRLRVLEFKALETPKSIGPTLANAAAPECLSVPTPSELPGRVGIPATPVSFPRSSAGARPSMDTEERTVASKRNCREPEHQLTAIPISVEPLARDQDRHADAAGGTVHIGSLEVKITPLPPAPPPSQAAVRRAPVVSSKPLSREFPTFGIGQAY